MPIRTNRGRAAVYRRLWGWPLRSPRHLVMTLVGAAVVVAVLTIVVARLSGPQHAAASAPTTASAVPTSTQNVVEPPPVAPTTSGPLPTRLTAAPQTPASTPPDPAALDIATRWTQAWANHPAGVSTFQWLQGMRPYTTEEYMTIMESIDPANVPATKVTGPATAESSVAGSIDVRVPTDGGPLSITLIQTADGWRVTHYDQGT